MKDCLHFCFIYSEIFCYVGVKDGRIPDNAMTASSTYFDELDAYYGRLDNTGNRKGFWHPARKFTSFSFDKILYLYRVFDQQILQGGDM